jgi:hypothetical protein
MYISNCHEDLNVIGNLGMLRSEERSQRKINQKKQCKIFMKTYTIQLKEEQNKSMLLAFLYRLRRLTSRKIAN